jgi:hypothetical protein
MSSSRLSKSKVESPPWQSSSRLRLFETILRRGSVARIGNKNRINPVLRMADALIKDQNADFMIAERWDQ